MSEDFWKAAQPIIKATESHPFLLGMINGTLPLESFKYYVIQDALYLRDFADCLRRLSKNIAEKSTDESKRLEEFAIGAEEAEMSLHNGFFERWGIDASNAESMPTTLLYTSNMLKVVATRDHAEGLAVLLPCFWVYMHIGKHMLKLREEFKNSGAQRCPQYNAWIDMYASDEFENDVRDYIALVDSAIATAPEEKIRMMKDHFLMSCKLEYLFWDQGWCQMEWPKFHEDNNDLN